VLDARTAWVTDSMLRDVTRYGTGAASVKKLGRLDIAGKTGTTSDAIDGWFAGYGGKVVAVAWMGYDEPRSLGGREFGATLALPIWIDYMRVALAKVPVQDATLEPEGVVRENDDWVFEEFVERPDLRAIDIDPGPDNPAPVADPLTGEETPAPPAPPPAPTPTPTPPQTSPLF
jgi:penicillin-binding protein 1A